MRVLLPTFLLGMSLIAGDSSAAENAPFKVGIPYAEARDRLLASGWLPTDYATADPDMSSDAKERDNELRAEFIKRGAPEVGSCVPTGLGQCFGIWRKGQRLFVVESRSEGYDPQTGPDVSYFYQVRLHSPLRIRAMPARTVWDPRSADIVPGSFPSDHSW
jgi:hypothetical protein